MAQPDIDPAATGAQRGQAQGEHPPSPRPLSPIVDPAQVISRVAADIVCFSCPIPFDVGSVNIYLLTGEPLTLIDTGSRANFDIDDLAKLVRRAGVELGDIEQLILTHRHIDHFGLAADIVDRAGCSVVASQVDGTFIAEWGPKVVGSRESLIRSGKAFGIPEKLFEINNKWATAIFSAAEAVQIDRLVSEGEVVRAGGRDLRVIECPGHTEGLVTFFDEASGYFFANDHVLRHITPNPDVYDYDPDKLRSGLPDYVLSLRKVRDLPVSLVLPGHGYEMSDLAGRVDAIIFHHDQRAEKVLGILHEQPGSVFDVVGKVWPKLRARDTHLAVREIIGHLVLLEDAGRVTHEWEGETLRYRAA